MKQLRKQYGLQMPTLDIQKLSKKITLWDIEKKTTMSIFIGDRIELNGQFYNRYNPKHGKHIAEVYIPNCYEGIVKIELTHPRMQMLVYNIEVRSDTIRSQRIKVMQEKREKNSHKGSGGFRRQMNEHVSTLSNLLDTAEAKLFDAGRENDTRRESRCRLFYHELKNDLDSLKALREQYVALTKRVDADPLNETSNTLLVQQGFKVRKEIQKLLDKDLDTLAKRVAHA